MTPEMKQRLLEHAASEIERQSEQLRYLGGNRAVVNDRLVSLPSARVQEQEVDEETWVLAIVGKWRRISNFLPFLESDFSVLGTVPRVAGFFAINTGFPQTISSNSTTGDYIHYEWEMYPRTYEPSQQTIPAPGPASELFGQPYPSSVRFVMRQRGPGFPGTVYQDESVTVFPQGTNFLAIPAVQDVNIEVSPVLNSFERVR